MIWVRHHARMNENTQETVGQFIEEMGMITQGDGLPRIAGKILGLLLIETGPYSFAEIAERLEVSRGSVSTNTRLLEGLGLINRVSKKGERGDFFQLADAPYAKLIEGVSKRMQKSISVLRKTRQALPSKWSESQGRLRDLETFYSEYLKSIAALVETLQKK